MTERRIVYFTAHGHDVYRLARGVLALDASFAVDERGVAQFRSYLREHGRAVYSVLADLAGEEFQEDLIPFLRGAERAAVVGRRLAQRFRDTRLATALSLGYVKEGRRNERLLLASFTQPRQFAPWLDAIAEVGAKLAGVYSVPLLAPTFAARLGACDGYCFLVSLNRAGLRQSFLDHGRLRFGRLERLVGDTPEAIALAVRSETVRLAQYLVTLRALPRDGSPIGVTLVAPAGAAQDIEREIDRAAAADERLKFRVLALDKALHIARLWRTPQQAGAELPYLALAAEAPPAAQFAQRTELARFVVWRMRRAIIAAGAAGLAACALYAGNLWRESHEAREHAAQARREARGIAGQYARIAATFPARHTSTENLKATVSEFQRIAGRSASPEPMLAHLSRVLERFPGIQIEALTWNAARSEVAAPAPLAAGGSAATADEAAEGLEIVGRLETPRRSDYRGIVGEIEGFAEALRAVGLRPGRIKLPFDVTSEGVLTGDTRPDSVASVDTRFSLLLTKASP